MAVFWIFNGEKGGLQNGCYRASASAGSISATQMYVYDTNQYDPYSTEIKIMIPPSAVNGKGYNTLCVEGTGIGGYNQPYFYRNGQSNGMCSGGTMICKGYTVTSFNTAYLNNAGNLIFCLNAYSSQSCTATKVWLEKR